MYKNNDPFILNFSLPKSKIVLPIDKYTMYYFFDLITISTKNELLPIAATGAIGAIRHHTNCSQLLPREQLAQLVHTNCSQLLPRKEFAHFVTTRIAPNCSHRAIGAISPHELLPIAATGGICAIRHHTNCSAQLFPR